MRPRGYSLVVALAALTTMFAVVMLLSRGLISRGVSQRGAFAREVALQKAENALEIARIKLERGELKPGAAFSAEELSVSSAQTPAGTVRLETRALLLERKPLKKTSSVQRAVRVAWELKSSAQGGGWTRVNWSAKDESVAP